ncbi:hypothetical protein KEM55_006128, partial [Ascosphaera atra]
MRSFTTALLLGGAAHLATAAPPAQQVLAGDDADAPVYAQPHNPPSSSSSRLDSLLHPDFSSIIESGREQLDAFQWDEFKDTAFDKARTFFEPLAGKRHTRRPDSHWTHIVRGADVQASWIEDADKTKHRELDGKLDTYDLRVKAVDPAALGVDPDVKQYSGYLDDNENDKHLFY